MSNNINLIAFGTFGNPNGFRQSYFIGDNSLSKVIKTFDLNTNAITLVPGSKIYAIRKENALGAIILSYSVYSFAKEQNSERSGTFIGSGILFTGKIAEESLTLKVLNECQNNLYNKNVKDHIILVNHSDQLSVSKPKDFDKLAHQLKDVEDLNSLQSPNKALVVYCNTDPTILKKALDLLNIYDTIYFTNSQEIAQYVHQKNIFSFVEIAGFEAEIKKLTEEKKRIRAAAIADFDKVIQQLEEDKSIEINKLLAQIDTNQRLHQQNEQLIKESTSELEQIKQYYSDFTTNIRHLSNQLKSGKRPQDVKEVFNENKRIFIESIERLEKPKFLNAVTKPIAHTGLRNELPTTYKQQSNIADPFYQEYHPHSRRKRIDIFKIASLLLLLLWIGTLIYFLVPKTTDVGLNPQKGLTDQISPNRGADSTIQLERPTEPLTDSQTKQ